MNLSRFACCKHLIILHRAYFLAGRTADTDFKILLKSENADPTQHPKDCPYRADTAPESSHDRRSDNQQNYERPSRIYSYTEMKHKIEHTKEVPEAAYETIESFRAFDFFNVKLLADKMNEIQT